MDHEDVLLSPDGDSATIDQNPKYQRSLRSLNLLAIRFVKLLQEAEGGILDLKEAVKILAVGQKRRIYDITNVLEGVGLIMKISKRIVKWMGAMPGDSAAVFTSRVTQLKFELADLEQQEFMLEQQKLWVEQSIRNTREDCSNLTYVNHEDLCNCFTGHTLLAVRAPSGTQLDVPIPKAVRNSPAKYQIHLKSFCGPVDVLLLNKSSPSSVPLVLPVPPPEEILRNAKLAMPTSDVTENSTAPSASASAHTGHCAKSRQTLMDDMQPPHASSLTNAEPKRAHLPQLQDLSKELKELLDPSKEITNANLITKLMTAEVLSPLFRLSSQPPGQEYACNRDEGEGVSDLFDIPMLNV